MLDLRVAGNACTYESSDVLDELTADRLGAVWPKVQPKLLRLLEKRGLTRPQAEDVCQDVAVRALASGVEFESAEDLYRWAGQVARNLHIDLLRSVSRIACDDSVLVEMQADTDVEHEVERRIALGKVLKHWITLRPLDQAALLEGMYTDGNEDRGEAVKLAVRRHRARQRLRLLTEGAFAWIGAATLVRRLRAVATAAPAATLVAAPVAFVLVAPIFAAPQPDGVRLTPAPAIRMAEQAAITAQPPAYRTVTHARPARTGTGTGRDTAPAEQPRYNAPSTIRAEAPSGDAAVEIRNQEKPRGEGGKLCLRPDDGAESRLCLKPRADLGT